MLIFIQGKNGSGKSRWAERLAAGTALPRFYVATMAPQNEENLRRIQKHRQQRAGLGFVTLEEPCRVGTLPVTRDSLVLLEDASNLLGNMLFSQKGSKEDALREILTLKENCRHLLVVSISGLDETAYDGETADFIRSLTWLNESLFRAADLAAELVSGRAILQKGELHGLD